MVDKGLDKGIGSLIDLKMYLQSKAHPGYPYDGPLHSWVACANNVTSEAPQYYWYVVASCANAAHDTKKTFEECAGRVPAAAVQPVRDCVTDTARANALVTEMHKIADSYGDYPTVLIDGSTSPAIPEPDTHGDKVGPLIKQICKLARGKGVSSLPPACSA